MKRLFHLSVLLAALVLSWLASFPAAVSNASANDFTTANWTLHTPDGVPVEIAKASKVRPQIVLFWATWCPYCKALMPHLQSIQMEYGNRLDILAVSITEDGDPVSFIDDAGYDFTLLVNGDAVADEYDIVGTPGVIVIDTHQQIRFDLRNLPKLELTKNGESLSHRQASKRLAPYWAAEIRKALDTL